MPQQPPRRSIGRTGRLFVITAFVEAGTWTGLLIGMFLKYVAETTDIGVRVFGWLHGIAFIAYLVSTTITSITLRWRWWVALTAVFAAIPPLATIPLEHWISHRDGLAPRHTS